jgi:hypothetical protein
MAGPPGHPRFHFDIGLKKDVEARLKAGHDEQERS